MTMNMLILRKIWPRNHLQPARRVFVVTQNGGKEDYWLMHRSHVAFPSENIMRVVNVHPTPDQRRSSTGHAQPSVLQKFDALTRYSVSSVPGSADADGPHSVLRLYSLSRPLSLDPFTRPLHLSPVAVTSGLNDRSFSGGSPS